MKLETEEGDRLARPRGRRPAAQDEEAESPRCLSIAEHPPLLHERNRTEQAYPRDKCVHQLFEEQVERTPGAVAVAFERDSLTYRVLNGRANQLAHHLRSLGVGPDILVGLCVERSLEMVVALLGILKAGGAYVPLDPGYPRDRLALMLDDARAPVLLTQKKFAADLTAHKAKVIYIDDPPQAVLSSQSVTNPPNLASSANLAYVIFTSGSTGRPKGVLVTHDNVVRLMLGTAEWFHFDERDVWTMFHSYAFDFSVWEIWGALLYGGKLVVVPYFVSRSPDAFCELLVAEKVTVLNQTPSGFRQLIQAESTSIAPRDLALRYVILGGEALEMQSLKPWFERHGDARPQLVNMYGITETTVHVTCRPLTRNDVLGPSMIGVPIPDLQLHILDANLQPVPTGVPGEIFVGGAGLARGYLNRPELTAERFIPNPFSGDPGARLYKTGDLVRRLPDGDIEFLGRSDHQVKIRGHRIELGEIESALGSHPQVASGAVLAQDRGGRDKVLAAVVVGREGAELSVGSLRQWLAEKLPGYMIPSRFVAIAALPLNPNGKLDRKALEKLDGVELASGVDYAAPRNERERELAEIWQAVLRRERVGVHENFFDLGGHSLLAVVICSQVNHRLGVEMPLRWVFEHPTVEGLAKQLESLGEHSENTCAIERADRQKPLPMSFAEQGMWLLQQTLPDPATYNESIAWRLSGRVDRERIRRALRMILERHEVLRTALVQEGESLVQQVAAAKDVPLPWREMDLQGVPHGDEQAVLEERLSREARRPFDLAHAPLWRAVWIALAEDEHVLAFTFHHSIVDEWSLRLFVQELQRLYDADGRLELAALPELPVQYADYAAWQRRRLTGELLERLRNYWTDQLRNLPPPPELPVDMTRPARSSGRGATHGIPLVGSVVKGLRELARQEGTTLFTVVLAAYNVWLHRCTGQTDLLVVTPLADRQQPEVQSLIGCFVNAAPIRVHLEGRLSFREVLRRVQATLLAAYSHAELPFEQVVNEAVRDRASGQQPLYRTMFALLEEGPPALHLDRAQSRIVPMGTRTSKCDLMLLVDAEASGLACRIEYSLDLYNGETIARMGEHLTQLLHSIAEDAGESVSRLQMIPPAERHRILVEWNNTERDYPRDRCIHEVFAEQAARTPDAIAVVCESQSLSYGQLNRRANRLARHLRRLGVRAGDLVGVRIERSLPMVMGLLGILKSGATYWGIEEGLPNERLRGMLADARPRVLLVSRMTASAVSEALAHASAEVPPLCTVAMIEDLLETEAEDDGAPDSSVTASTPAYLNYTSGSTGQPKGVLVPHRAVVRLVKGAEPLALNADETLLHLSSIAFDASTFELWGALLNGGRVVLLPQGWTSLQDIGDTIRRHAVTTLWLTAGLFHLMLDERPDDLRSLRRLIAGGDVLSAGHVRKALRLLPGCRIVNGYGPTENTTFTCCYLAEDEAKLDSGVPIGRPIANTQVYVLDADLQPVPIGVAGELYAGGDGVACGYLNQPHLTSERFVPDPFSSVDGARLYRTGDRVRWRPDGDLEFLGRMDAQVKIRGFRVEPGEIEVALRASPAVSAAAVAAGDPGPDGRRLVAYVVTVGDVPLDEAALRIELKSRLPEYMIPSQFVQLAALPLTPYGKLDRNSLPWPDRGQSIAEPEIVLPRDDLERKVAQAFETALGLQRVGAHGDFFDLGGHSLQVLRLQLELEKTTARKLPISAVFRSRTVERLAALLREERTPQGLGPLLALRPKGSKPPFFIVHPGSGADYYYNELVPRLDADLPVYALQPPGYDGKQPPCRSVEDIAARLIDEMLTVQPSGPYALGGVSYGGVIAWEIARQLDARGDGISFLALFDTHFPAFGRKAPSHSGERRRGLPLLTARWKTRIRFHASALALLAPREMPRYVGELAARAMSPAVRARAAARWKRPRTPTIQDVNDAVAQCRQTYVPPPYAGPVHLFRAQIQDPTAPPQRDLGWSGRAVGGIVIHDVPGLHSSMVREPHVRALAQVLQASLEARQRGNGHGGVAEESSVAPSCTSVANEPSSVTRA